MNRLDWQIPRVRAPYREQRFGAMDPGTSGTVLLFSPDLRFPIACVDASRPRLVAQAFGQFGVQVLVAETQYVTNLKRARGIIELTLNMGVALGYVDALLGQTERELSLFEVAPSTWQKEQRVTRTTVTKPPKGFA
ncbi:hypothetical protein UFOVP650_91, partial [uncultured Caudovirales phage]